MSIEANPVCTRDHEESPRLVIRLPPLFPSLALASRVSSPGILGAPSASKSRLSHQSIERRGPRGVVMVWFGMVSFVSFSCQFANPADMQLAMPPLVPQRAYCSCCLISFPFPAQGRLVPVTTSYISEHAPLLPRLHVPLPPSPTPCLAPPLLKLLPRNLAKLAQRLELPIPQPHTRRPQDPRVHRQRVAHRLVRRHARVVPQRKVVAARVPDLVAADGRGEHEDAPVVDVADDAAVAEDELAGCEDDSGGRGGLVLSSSRVVGGVFE